jgi:hemerythrin-like domain-containing protein
MEAMTQPLRDEHRELRPMIERIRHVADAVGVVPPQALHEQVAEVRAFLAEELLPHAKGEEAALYPAVARILGSPEATATMRHDHGEVAWLTEQLAAVLPELRAPSLPLEVERALRRILYGLYALVRVHVEEEEDIYLPLLDAQLTAEEAREMFRVMHLAEAREHAAV